LHGTKPDQEQPIVRDTWAEKYRYGDEPDYAATCLRVVSALCANETSEFRINAAAAMQAREIVPAGRILAGAGTDKRVTLINCFVSPDIQDSMRSEAGEPGCGIMHALSKAAYTQQMGGGIGMDFSTVRPRGALVRRTNSVSSGVLPFMDMWDAMCATIRSSGSRRGAMMGTLGIWHPAIEEFVEAKQQRGRLTNFNVSVLVPDAFMWAVEQDWGWDLHFPVPRADNKYGWSSEGGAGTSTEGGYIYKVVRARDLWDKIIRATYVHAEPGVIFIDRINQLNNLAYCEDIHCVNPCGEQALPANGACNLGHTNLAVMVDRPFEPDASFDWDKLERAAAIMVRLLDNVLDVTQWPLEEQAEEARAKRRIGLGFTGLATALQQLGIPYGSPAAVEFTREVARRQAIAAYKASVQLAEERGPFPLFDPRFCDRPFVKKLPSDLRLAIEGSGIRNGVLLSVAPTGTTSLVMGNVSSGIEPVFAHKYRRKVRGDSGEMSNEYSVYDYGYLKYCGKHAVDPNDPRIETGEEVVLPPGFVTADQLTVEQHLQMAAAAQEWVDSAISKTINCPESMGIDEFRAVYGRAYELGLKGCTTYRPDPRSGRGAVLEAAEAPSPLSALPTGPSGSLSGPPNTTEFITREEVVPNSEHRPVGPDNAQPRPDKISMRDVVPGLRYRIKWPHEDCAYYVIITDVEDAAMPRGRRPFELFISTKSTRHEEWVKAFSLMATAIFRREGDPSFIVDELRTVFSAKGGGWVPIAGKEGRRHVPSLVAAVGLKIEEHLRYLGMLEEAEPLIAPADQLTSHAADMERCEVCGALAVVHEAGCSSCRACGASDCG
jgi:ribonucleoside-diphosphate reductase alpha chain